MMIGKRHYWLLQLLGWGGFFLFHIFNAWSFDMMNIPEYKTLMIQRNVGFSIIGIFMSHGLRCVLLQSQVLNKRVASQIVWFILLTLATSCVAGILEMVLYKQLHLHTKGEAVLANRSFILSALTNAFAWFSFFIIWSAVYFIYHHVGASQKEQIGNLKLKSHINELELKTIKMHINPHFIFNALNGIRAMVDEDPQRARTAITELSNILRSSINIDKSETVSLADELQIVKDYLALEKMRFEDRLSIEYHINEGSTLLPVPPMMLQMMVENAIKHGISQEINGGVVIISSFTSESHLVLTVENSGTLKEPLHDGGFGIISIKKRLRFMYDNKASFHIEQSASNRVTGTLKIPAIS